MLSALMKLSLVLLCLAPFGAYAQPHEAYPIDRYHVVVTSTAAIGASFQVPDTLGEREGWAPSYALSVGLGADLPAPLDWLLFLLEAGYESRAFEVKPASTQELGGYRFGYRQDYVSISPSLAFMGFASLGVNIAIPLRQSTRHYRSADEWTTRVESNKGIDLDLRARITVPVWIDEMYTRGLGISLLYTHPLQHRDAVAPVSYHLSNLLIGLSYGVDVNDPHDRFDR